jgi:hypothetical protein
MKLDKVLDIPKAETKQTDNDIDIDKIDNEARRMTDMYFNNEINEPETRLKLHYEACDKMEQQLPKTVEEGTNPRNYFVMDRFKNNILEYINFARSEQFAKESTQYAKTLDNMRVDFGVVISRAPIFLG